MKIQIGREVRVLSRSTLKGVGWVHTEVHADHQEGTDRKKGAEVLEGQDQGRDREDQADQGKLKEEGQGLKVELPHQGNKIKRKMSYKRIPDHGAGQRREQDQNQDEKIQNQLIQRRGRRLWGDQSRQKTQLTSLIKETSKGTSYLYYYYVITIYYYRFFNINVKFKIRIFLYLKLLHFHSNFEKLIQ